MITKKSSILIGFICCLLASTMSMEQPNKNHMCGESTQGRFFAGVILPQSEHERITKKCRGEDYKLFLTNIPSGDSEKFNTYTRELYLSLLNGIVISRIADLQKPDSSKFDGEYVHKSSTERFLAAFSTLKNEFGPINCQEIQVTADKSSRVYISIKHYIPDSFKLFHRTETEDGQDSCCIATVGSEGKYYIISSDELDNNQENLELLSQ